MKKNIHLIVLICTLAVLASCGSKTKETTEDAAVAKADSIAAEKTKSEEIAARREQRAKAAAEKEEQRKAAAAEKAKATPTYKDASGKIVYYKAEEDPAYVGGKSEMNKYLRDNLKYPQSALDAKVEGTVFVDFIVNEKGQVRDVIATEAIGDNIDASLKEEAVRVVSAMPAWTPGRNHGKPVETAFSVPITFEITN